MDNTYWNNKGTYQQIVDKLENLIPLFNEVENPEQNPKLEKFRKAGNCYYQIYNNGNFSKAYNIFRVGLKKHTDVNGVLTEYGQQILETEMDIVVLEAAREQGIV